MILTSRLIACTAAVILLAGEPRSRERVQQYDGFVLFPIPTTADPPGTVFRIDQSHTRFVVTDLSNRIPVHRADVAVPDYRNTEVAKANFLLSFLRRMGILSGPSVSVSGSLSSAVSVRIDTAEREFTEDAEVDTAISRGIAGLPIKAGSKYYVIRETISAKRVAYTFEKQFLQDAQTTGKIGQVANAEAMASWNSSHSSELDQRFQVPHRVLYKAEQIVVGTGFGGTVHDYQRIPIAEPVDFNPPPASAR